MSYYPGTDKQPKTALPPRSDDEKSFFLRLEKAEAAKETSRSRKRKREESKAAAEPAPKLSEAERQKALQYLMQWAIKNGFAKDLAGDVDSKSKQVEDQLSNEQIEAIRKAFRDNERAPKRRRTAINKEVAVSTAAAVTGFAAACFALPPGAAVVAALSSAALLGSGARKVVSLWFQK